MRCVYLLTHMKTMDFTYSHEEEAKQVSTQEEALIFSLSKAEDS